MKGATLANGIGRQQAATTTMTDVELTKDDQNIVVCYSGWRMIMLTMFR